MKQINEQIQNKNVFMIRYLDNNRDKVAKGQYRSLILIVYSLILQ